ncbi:MAG: Gfo/Idh/MocA family oxidoreductase [Candidatus Nealsonbacteria bacterium]|nr:Gfo/Idh/MocA family oxidoreductase [Candidatus Nealsonbacteria bacterium]
MSGRSNRRTFLKKAALGTAGLTLLGDGRSAMGYQANEKLNIACVGVGGRGGGNTGAMGGENLVALCDVDGRSAAGNFKRFPQAKQFADFRKMFDEMHKQIDAVVVSTPDHTHAVVCNAAMKLGKHVYCEKPLTRTVHEARVLRETAAKQKVVTQMGNQGSASEGLRRAVELARSRAVVGEVKEAHVWLKGGNGPQDRPADRPEVPEGLDWDLWLGPAPERPYHPCYVPFQWRNWRSFGTGAMGDMGCHTSNIAFRALRLDALWNPHPLYSPAAGAIIRVEAEASEIHAETYPSSMQVRYELPARGKLPPVTLTWYNGGPKPPEDRLLGHKMTDYGCLLVGAEGSVFSECPWNTRFVMLPQKKFEGFDGPRPSLPRSPGHHAEWISACKGESKAFSPFAVGSCQTEMLLLGNVALLAGKPIEYDPATGKVVNDADANRFLHRTYRAGWEL